MSDLSINPSLYTMTFDIEVKFDVEIAIEIPLLREFDIDPVIVFAAKTNFNGHFDKCPFYIGQDYIKTFFHTLIPDIVEDKGAF
ncbi:MAG: hypothetical protein MJ219_01600 [Mycoplasmoidaceae bacterium]|nr:hypothetical protein [Mycoplasmoidaceae bacterium]